MDPVRERKGYVGERVRLRPPADWGFPSLTDPADVPQRGVPFTIALPDSGESYQLFWFGFMSELARDRAVGVVVEHSGGGMPGLLPVGEFPGARVPGGLLDQWRCVVHPTWLEYLGSGDPLGPECSPLTCPTAQLMTIGCTCGRARRERAVRLQRERDRA